MALSESWWTMNINLLNVAISGPYWFFFENIGCAFTEGSLMAGGMLLFGSHGCTVIESSMTMMINVLIQSCSYIEYICPSVYAEMMISMQFFYQLQNDIMAELSSCKSEFFSLAFTCGPCYGKIAQFLWWFAYYFNWIIVSWCDICSVMPDFCIEPQTTTSSSTVS